MVSNLGKVKVLERDVHYSNRVSHKKERLLSLHYNSDGYLNVKFKDNKQYRVHRLVAKAFIPNNNEDLLEIDHINNIRDDNRVENLRWVSHQQNIIHTVESGNSHIVKNRGLNLNAQRVKLIHKDSKEVIEFNCLKDCCEWIKYTFNLETKIMSIYDSLRKKNINNKTYYNFYVKYI